MSLDPALLSPPPAFDNFPEHGGHALRPEINGHNSYKIGEGSIDSY